MFCQRWVVFSVLEGLAEEIKYMRVGGVRAHHRCRLMRVQLVIMTMKQIFISVSQSNGASYHGNRSTILHTVARKSM